MIMTDIAKALEIIKKLELSAQAFYEYYHDVFSADKEASGCFFMLSLEEKSHADLIDYQIRTIRKNKSLFNNVEFDAGVLNQWISKLEAHIASKEPASLESVLQIALELETDALEHQYIKLIAQSNPDVGELIKKLTAAENEHYKKLQKLALSRGHSVSGR